MNNGRVYLAYFLRLLLVIAIIVSVIWLVYITVQFAQGELSGDPDATETDGTSQDVGEVESPDGGSEEADSDAPATSDAESEPEPTSGESDDTIATNTAGDDADLPQTGPAETTGLIAMIVLSIVVWNWISSRQQLSRAHTEG